MLPWIANFLFHDRNYVNVCSNKGRLNIGYIPIHTGYLALHGCLYSVAFYPTISVSLLLIICWDYISQTIKIDILSTLVHAWCMVSDQGCRTIWLDTSGLIKHDGSSTLIRDDVSRVDKLSTLTKHDNINIDLAGQLNHVQAWDQPWEIFTRVY